MCKVEKITFENDTVICEECEYEVYMFFVIDEDVFLCSACFEENYFFCGHCEEYHHMDEHAGYYYVGNSNGYNVCQSCYDEEYGMCDDCGYLFNLNYDEGVWLEDKEVFICDDCKDSYYHCDDCGKWVSEGVSDDTGRQLCDSCFEYGYTFCDECRRIVTYDNSISDDYHTYCEDCSGGLMPYGSNFDDLIFYEMNDEPENAAYTLYMGIELEVDRKNPIIHSEHTYEFRKRTGFQYDNDMFLFKQDSSIPNGFEIVTQPCSLRYHREMINWKDGMDYLKKAGYLGDSDEVKAGLHVTIDRVFFGQWGQEQIKNIGKFCMLLEKHKQFFEAFSRRNYDQLSWCRFKWFIDDAYRQFKLYSENGKYTAVNIKSDDVLEIRLFRSTLDHKVFYACLEMIEYLARLSKIIDEDAINDMSIHDVFKPLYHNGYNYHHLKWYLFEYREQLKMIG